MVDEALDKAVSNSEKINPIALSVVELQLAESISWLVSQKKNSVI